MVFIEKIAREESRDNENIQVDTDATDSTMTHIILRRFLSANDLDWRLRDDI